MSEDQYRYLQEFSVVAAVLEYEPRKKDYWIILNNTGKFSQLICLIS